MADNFTIILNVSGKHITNNTLTGNWSFEDFIITNMCVIHLYPSLIHVGTVMGRSGHDVGPSMIS
jgi:hypothetical protein